MINKSQNPSVPIASGFDEFVEDEGIDLRHYLRVVLRYKRGILGLVIAVGLFTTVWAYSLQPVYRSTATLLIGGNETLTDQGPLSDRSGIGTQYQLIKSRKVAMVVLEQLGMDRAPIPDQGKKDATPAFNWRDWIPQSWLSLEWVPRWLLNQDWFPQAWLEPAPETEVPMPETEAPITASDPDKARLGWLSAGLEVAPIKGTSMVTISFEASEPKLAARVANAFTRAYIDNNLKQRLESTAVASEWLEEQLEKSRQHVMESAEVLQQYREETGLTDLEGMHSIAAEQLKGRAADLSEARRVRSQAESLYQRAEGLRKLGQMDAIPEVLENPRIRSLRDQERKLLRQIRLEAERFQGDYPGLGDARSTLQAVRDEMDEALDKLVESFKTSYELASANVGRLQGEVRTLEASVQQVSRKQLEARTLERTVETNRQAYDAFLKQLMDTSTRSADTVSTIARVIDPAVPVFTPYKPNKRRMLMIALLLALFCGIAVALLLDKFDNTLKSREDVQERLNVPVLGELVMLKGKRDDGKPFVPHMEFADEPSSSFAEHIRTIRTGIVLSGLDESHQTLVVTSTLAGEGKSTVAINLALALAQLGTVLLIDADMRRPSLARQLGQDSRRPGLTDLVAGTATVKQCLFDMSGGIRVLFAGSTVPPDPIKVLSSKRFSELLAKAATTFDMVVIDSAPVELVSDARMLASKATGIVYVVKADATPHQAVHAGLSALIDTGTPLLGVVLNQIDPEQAHAYGKYKYGYSRYGSYSHYSYGHDSKPATLPTKLRKVG